MNDGAMGKNELLVKEIYSSVFGDPWHGSSIKKILENINDTDAIFYVSKGSHNILEIVLHMWSWTDEIINRLNDNIPNEPKHGDWPDIKVYIGGSIKEAVERLFTATEVLIERLKIYPEEKLNEMVGKNREPQLGTGLSFEEMIHGLAQHNAYHAGQISFLMNHINRTKLNAND